ncbi:MAG: DUF177 domain-containing protein [Bacteroidales bacterium]|nr:DUF177 domain-containing protein [Bacteroidales bacterium]
MDYSISFTPLTLGEHRFDFEVDKSLFDNFENEDILGANITLKVNLLKEERMLTLNFQFNGVLNVLCDRCLDPLEINIKGENTLFIKFGEEYLEEDDDVIVISNKEHKIDLSQHIYEYILLQKPMKCVHEISKCNSDIVERINKKKEDNDKSIDPRWSALKNIKFE